jgi:hypothetical protein
LALSSRQLNCRGFPRRYPKILAFGLAAACAALAQEAIPYSLDCQRHILVDENHYFEAIDVFDDYDIDFDVIRNF